MENIDIITECGFSKPISRLDLSDKTTILQSVALHKVILMSLAELTQFRDGLSALGVLGALQEHPNLLRSYYCLKNSNTLTSGMPPVYYCCNAIIMTL